MSATFNLLHKQPVLLVVDADDNSRACLAAALVSSGYRVLEAGDATAALRTIHQDHCDLVLLDIALPGIDGLALCRLLRARHVSEIDPRLPLIIISQTADERERIEAYESGADDFIAKDAPEPELLSRIRIGLETAERERHLAGSNREWSFLADLGRSLLRAQEPAEVVRRVAGATFEGANAALCLAAVMSEDNAQPALVGCLFDRDGSAEDISEKGGGHIVAEQLTRWIGTNAPQPAGITERNHFLCPDEAHGFEYVAPLRFGEKNVGVLVAAYESADACGAIERRLIDSAAQLAALAAHISLLYTTARLTSVQLAREVERRTAEAERQRRFTEAIIDSLPVSLYAIDGDYRIVAWNRNRELGGQGVPRGSAIGRNIFDVLTRQPRDVLEREFERVFETAEIERIEQEAVDHDGRTKHWLISKIPMRAEGSGVSHVITVGEDATARVEANRAVARAEKLAAVGRLAAGVVHEINNPLATIAACAEALESRVAEGVFGNAHEVDDLREYLGLIRSEAFRCKTITNGLLDFSRQRAGQFQPIDLRTVLVSAARLVGHQQRGGGVRIEQNAPEDLPTVAGDEGQLQQAVIALATNAIDAMPEGGTLRFAARHNAKRTKVFVEVGDTGVGIVPEHLKKIFEPFFTTKEVGCGTGLGLAVCYGIVSEHGGTLSVESTVGRGTTFTITLPAHLPNSNQR